MLSLIEVKCPHCGARGQIMMPPLGAIIVGPCPECQEMVVVYCGRVLALDKEIMNNGNVMERKEHLMAVLTDFVSDRVDRLLDPKTESEDHATTEFVEESAEAGPPGEVPEQAPEQAPRVYGEDGQEPVEGAKITEEELSDFVNRDLRLIDNKDYFKAMFD